MLDDKAVEDEGIPKQVFERARKTSEHVRALGCRGEAYSSMKVIPLFTLLDLDDQFLWPIVDSRGLLLRDVLIRDACPF